MERNKKCALLAAAAAIANLFLFLIKLYIGLSGNSVVIFSDAINSSADAAACLVLCLCFLSFAGMKNPLDKVTARRAELLLSFCLWIMVAAVGLGFLLSAIERLMYPTPVWFEMHYFYLLLLSIGIKLSMFFLFGYMAKSANSEAFAAMKKDSLTDSAVTAVALISFTLAQTTQLAIDALAGLLLCGLLLTNATAMIIKTTRRLLCTPDSDTRGRLFDLLCSELGEDKIKACNFAYEPDGSLILYLHTENIPSEEVEERLVADCKENYNVNIIIIK